MKCWCSLLYNFNNTFDSFSNVFLLIICIHFLFIHCIHNYIDCRQKFDAGTSLEQHIFIFQLLWFIPQKLWCYMDTWRETRDSLSSKHDEIHHKRDWILSIESTFIFLTTSSPFQCWWIRIHPFCDEDEDSFFSYDSRIIQNS